MQHALYHSARQDVPTATTAETDRWGSGILRTVISLQSARTAFFVALLAAPAVVLWAARPDLLGSLTKPILRVMPSTTRTGPVRQIERFLTWSDAPEEGPSRELTPEPRAHNGGRRSLLVVAACASAIAAMQAVWIWNHRTLGNLDWDEARYVAGSYQFENLLSSGHLGELYMFFGPFVPIISAVGMLVLPDDPRTAISMQLVLSVGIAVSVAGITRRLAGPAAAGVAGVLVALLPAMMATSQVFLLVLGSALGLTAATWALLASDHGNNWRIWLVGPLLAIAPLSRGMTLGLLPAFFLATLLYVSVSSRGFRRACVSLALASAALAAFFLTWGWPIVTYVVRGLNAPTTQDVGLWERIAYRWSEVSDGVGRPLLVIGLATAIVGLFGSVRNGGLKLQLRGHALVAVSVAVLGGGSALLLGGYFGPLGFWDFPLIPLLVVLLVALGSKAVAPIPALVASVTLVWLGYLALVTLWILPFDAPLSSWGLGRYSMPLFEVYNRSLDPRFEPERRSEQRQASEEWTRASIAIDQRLHAMERSREGLEVLYAGGSNYVQYSAWILNAQEGLDPRPWGEILADGDRDAVLDTRDSQTDRLLLVPQLADNTSEADGGRSREELESARNDDAFRTSSEIRAHAELTGWEVVARLDLPLGDELLFYSPPMEPRQ